MQPPKLRILLVQNLSIHPRRLPKFLKQYGAVTTVPYRRLDPRSTDNYDLVVLSGGHPRVIGHSRQFKRELDFIRTTDRPVIGICLGFELIVRAHGGNLHHLKHRRHGLYNLSALDATLAAGSIGPTVYESHRWGTLQLPDQLIARATSADGIEVLQHSTKPMYGCQFHPEVTSPVNDGQAIFERILANLF